MIKDHALLPERKGGEQNPKQETVIHLQISDRFACHPNNQPWRGVRFQMFLFLSDFHGTHGTDQGRRAYIHGNPNLWAARQSVQVSAWNEFRFQRLNNRLNQSAVGNHIYGFVIGEKNYFKIPTFSFASRTFSVPVLQIEHQAQLIRVTLRSDCEVYKQTWKPVFGQKIQKLVSGNYRFTNWSIGAKPSRTTILASTLSLWEDIWGYGQARICNTKKPNFWWNKKALL